MTDGFSAAASSTSVMMLPKLAHLVLDTFDDGDFPAYAKELVAFLDRRIRVKKSLELKTGAGQALRSLRLRHSQCTEKEKSVLLKRIGAVLVDVYDDDVADDDVAGDPLGFEENSNADDKDRLPSWDPDTNDSGALPDDGNENWIHSEDSSYTDEDAIQDDSEDSDNGGMNTDDDLPPGWGIGGGLGHLLDWEDQMWADNTSDSSSDHILSD